MKPSFEELMKQTLEFGKAERQKTLNQLTELSKDPVKNASQIKFLTRCLSQEDSGLQLLEILNVGQL